MEKVFKRLFVLIIIGIILFPALMAWGQEFGLAYCLSDSAFEENGISVVNDDGSWYNQLIHWEAWTVSPDWSPNGKDIVFSANKDFNNDIYIISANGTNLRNITNTPGFQERNPSWSPDGKKITYCGYPAWGQTKIYVMDIDTQEYTQITQVPGYYPKWSPDSSKIAMIVSDDICFVNPDGSNLVNITKTPAMYEQDLSWSPDGQYIVYSASQDAWRDNYDIYRMHVESGVIKTIVDSPGIDMMPSYSPDGKRIAFVSDQDALGIQYDIYIVDASGKNGIRFTETPLSEWYPAWSSVPLAVNHAGKMKISWGKVKSR